MRTIVWFRKDLRVADHAPLRDAAAAGEVIPLFLLDPRYFRPERARGVAHRMQFLLDSLRALDEALAARGSRLVVVAGRALDVLPRLVTDWRADRVVAHRRVEPRGRETDRKLRALLGTRFELAEGETLLPPGRLRTGAGRPYTVFTPFARAFFRAEQTSAPLGVPRRLPPLPAGIDVGRPIPTLEELGIPRSAGVLPGGEPAASARLRQFLRGAAARYDRERDRLDRPGTSRLSADLKLGTISVRRVFTAVARRFGGTAAGRAFLNEIVWREFTHSTLWDRPELLRQPFQPRFAGFPWSKDERGWAAWVEGRTGYPVVDASARQLLAEGFVPNRARMISASFLTKHLLIDYRRGERHYLAQLTDGDPAQNNAGWQWAAGCGSDAQPYFRIFHPVTQGERFDPDGDYVRRFVPELARMPARYVHRPWEAPPGVLRDAGVSLDVDYPRPIIDHREARARYLAVARAHLRQ